MIKFWARVTLTRVTPVTGVSRYSPNVRFRLSTLPFGLTTIDDADWPLSKDKAKLAHFTMIRNPDKDADLFDSLARAIAPGDKFALMEGPFVAGFGVITVVEARGLEPGRQRRH